MIVDMTRGVFRRIYSSVTRDRRINQLSTAGELLYWRLHCVADDFGAFEADPYLLQCSALPLRREFDQPAIAAALKELIAVQLIELYRVEGEQFGSICGFTNIQPCNRTGRRIRRYPPVPGVTDEEADAQRNWTQVVHPEPSCLHQNENQSESQNESESENENQNESFPPSLRLAGECENISAQENPAKEQPAATVTPAHLLESIYEEYPRHVGKKDARVAIQHALRALEKRPENCAKKCVRPGRVWRYSVGACRSVLRPGSHYAKRCCMSAGGLFCHGLTGARGRAPV